MTKPTVPLRQRMIEDMTKEAVTMSLTTKQEKFCLASLEMGNASEAYRRAYNAARMKAATVNRKAAELMANGKVTARIAELRGQAAQKVVLDRAWVLERLMRNVKIAMGEERIKIAVRPKGKDEAIELEVTDRDAAAANRALELLGKTAEVRLFVEVNEHTGKNGTPLNPTENRDPVKDHLEGLSKRYGLALAAHERELAKTNDSQPSEAAINQEARRWVQSNRRDN